MSFNAVAAKIASEYRKKGMSKKQAAQVGRGAAAEAARNASPAAKRKNPNLKNVKG